MANKYTMKETVGVAKLASSDIESYLAKQPETISIINVEDEKEFQWWDIDLIQKTKDGVVLIEIKGDRIHHTGNYFFETISNASKDTKGCFLYTLADYIYYYYVDQKELHMLPMPATSNWFKDNMYRFKMKTVYTPAGNDKYPTIGRVVPRKIVQEEVQGVEIKFLDKS